MGPRIGGILSRLAALVAGASAAFVLAGASSARTASPEAIRLALAGDTMLGRLVDEAISRNGPRWVWGDVLPLLREADLALVNLECVIASAGRPFEPPRVFYFRARPGAVEALREAGIDAVVLANNHAMDFRAEGLLETLRHLDLAGIAHAGAGENLAAAARPAILERRGLRVGIVAFADHYPEYAATPSSAGTHVIPISLAREHFSRIEQAIAAARGAGAEWVVFSIHWGPNLREAPTPEFVDFARAVVDAGADVFHGHSAHVFQAIEIYRGKPILYDTGDLLDDYAVHRELRNDLQLLFLLTVSGKTLRAVELVPLRIRHMQVNRAVGEDFRWIAETIRRRSAPFGTSIETAPGGVLRVDLGRPAQ
jgi:poly-gamma-glutamate capsule biosynthesis protein CapA/YwtB (metallophosphatase superfamily)